MNAPAKSGRRISTGLFEVDLTTGQVLRHGSRIPLQEQPFRVLALLLERPGQVVTREELQSRLWPADTYVSFDEGLNTAIRKLRILFGDSADNPRFIETIPRRGYRFIAPVSELSNGDASHQLSTEMADSKSPGASATPTMERPGIREKPSHSRIWIGLLAICMAAVILVVAAITHRNHLHASGEATPAMRAMLAVLPFQNLSNDPAQDYFSDGLTEETITDLGQLSPAQLGVIARTSAMAYKHTDKTVGEIGRELGVDCILEGSVRRENGRARISAQLIRVSDQTHLWAQSYEDRNLNDLLDVQNAIGRAIAEQVRVSITPQRQLEMSKMRPVNPEAYDLYLKGRFYWNQRMPSANRESIRYFKEAIAADPNFAMAYAGLADAYNFSTMDDHSSPKDAFPLAREAATRAIQLDPSLAEAHAALGVEKSHFDFDFSGARAEFLKAIELNPNSANAHFFYSSCYLSPMRRSAEAIAENKKALELDPLSLPINTFMGNTYEYAGDYSQAYQQFQHAVAMNPNFAWAHGELMDLLEVMGRFEEAIDERQKADALFEWTPQEASERAARMREALKAGGEKAYWKERLAQDLHREGKPDEFSFVLAVHYSWVGDKDEAFKWLEKAYEEREGQDLSFLAVDPYWKNLHGDPRFSDLLRRIGLPEPE